MCMNKVIKRITQALQLLLPVCVTLLVGCSETELPALPGETPGKELKLKLRLPVPTEVNTRSTEDKTAEERLISHLFLLAYDAGDQCVAGVSLDDQLTAANAGTAISVPVPAGAVRIHLVANAANFTPGTSYGLPANLTRTADPTEFLMWGSFSVADALAVPLPAFPVVTLYHSIAKMTLANTAADFIIDEWKVANTAARGMVAPTAHNIASALPNVGSGNSFATTRTAAGVSAPVYLYETPAGKNTRIVIKGRYKGTTGYYTAAVLDDTATELNLLRNHWYKATVTSVNHNGYATEAEALAAPAGNIRIDIKDDNLLIFDMVAEASYELGVCDTVQCNWDDTEVEATFVTTYPATPAHYTLPTPIATDWITAVTEFSQAPTAGLSSTGFLVTLKATLTANEYSDRARKGYFEVKSGSLTKRIYIRQGGQDLKRSRTTLLKGLEASAINYWTFMETSGLGVSAEMMQVERGDGLHFSVGENTYTYEITRQAGDVVSVPAGSFFNVVNMGAHWAVSLNNNASTDDTMEGTFTLTNGSVTINYKVYRTGLFHNVVTTHQVGTPLSGWRYYEQVRLPAEQGGFVFLDRNLGASSNRFYASSVSGIESYAPAMGAYYRIAPNQNGNTVVDAICPPGFTIPNMNVLLSAGITSTVRTSPTGDSYYSSELATTSDDLPLIYFPWAGYREGNNLKSAVNGYYWSTTLLAGNQGFSSESPEYGFWYRYLNLGRMVSEANMRLVDGSNGGAGTVFKGLSVRCVKKGSSLNEPLRLTFTRATGSDAPPSGDLYLYIFNEGTAKYENKKWPGIKLHFDSENKAYYYMVNPEDFPAGGDRNFRLIINNNGGWQRPTSGGVLIGDTRAFTIKNSGIE